MGDKGIESLRTSKAICGLMALAGFAGLGVCAALEPSVGWWAACLFVMLRYTARHEHLTAVILTTRLATTIADALGRRNR